MNRIASFTEYGLLNQFALDLLDPSDFQKCRIQTTSNSALEALENTPINPYCHPQSKSYLHQADKYLLLTPLKVAYSAFVTLTLSRLGVIFNGCLTAYSCIHYTYGKPANDEQAWSKVEGYAFAFFADTVCAVIGSITTKFIIEYSVYALHFARVSSLMGKCYMSPLWLSTAYVVLSVAVVILSSMGLIALQSPNYAPQFLAKTEERVGMFLSLSLRKSLGLVNQNGSLLPFSKEDELTTENIDKLTSYIANAELELVAAVVECNRFLKQKILFKYPFNGDAIASTFKIAHSGAGTLLTRIDAALLSLNYKLRSLQLKINFSKKLFETAQQLAFSDSLPVAFIKSVFKIPVVKFSPVPKLSYVLQEGYRDTFNCSSHTNSKTSPAPDSFAAPLDEFWTKPIKEFWASIQIESINPNQQTRPTENLFKQFQYDIAVNKWKSENNQGVSEKEEILALFREMLNVTNLPYPQYVKQKRCYLLAIHPDKHTNPQDKKIAEELFKCLSDNIIKQLDKAYESAQLNPTTDTPPEANTPREPSRSSWNNPFKTFWESVSNWIKNIRRLR